MPAPNAVRTPTALERENESLIADMADSLSHLLLTAGVATRDDLARLGFTTHAIDAFHAVAMERAKDDPRVVEALAQNLVAGDA